MTPELPDHNMNTKYEHNGVYWVECPDCGRLVILTSGDLAIVEPGDQYAAHHWSAGGLQIGASVDKEL